MASGRTESLRDTSSRRLRPPWRKGRDEHTRLRLRCPCRHSPPVWSVSPWGKHVCFPSLDEGYEEERTMKDLNCVQLIGHVGQDPEVHYTDRGTARTTFSVATSRNWTDADGQAQAATEWSRCITWGKLAEIS